MKVFAATLLATLVFTIQTNAQSALMLTDFELVPASATTQTLGPVGGAGDIVSQLVVNVGTSATGTVTLFDGVASTMTVTSANTPIGVYSVNIGARSVSGPWKVTTGAGATVMAVGRFK